MTLQRDPIDEIEEQLREEAGQLTNPHAGECLMCFVARAVDELGCDTTLRWSKRYRDLTAPRAVGLERRLGNVGGFCDCEIFLNGFSLVPSLLIYDSKIREHAEPEDLPGCGGVRRGNTQHCANWQRLRRW